MKKNERKKKFINTNIQQGRIKLIKSDSKDINSVTKSITHSDGFLLISVSCFDTIWIV